MSQSANAFNLMEVKCDHCGTINLWRFPTHPGTSAGQRYQLPCGKCGSKLEQLLPARPTAIKPEALQT
jgi:hypothetical protein